MLTFMVKGVNAVAAFALVVLLARIAGAETVGQYALAFSTATLVGIVPLFGLDMMALKTTAVDCSAADIRWAVPGDGGWHTAVPPAQPITGIRLLHCFPTGSCWHPWPISAARSKRADRGQGYKSSPWPRPSSQPPNPTLGLALEVILGPSSSRRHGVGTIARRLP
jgi:hypothetical protein